MKLKRLFLLILPVFLIGAVIESDLAETLKQKLFNYIQENPSTALYLHTDKDIYSPGEKIWFKAYVLSATITNNKVIYVRLADKNKRIVLSDQFAMHDVTGNGELILPDSLREDNYTLYAYTDKMINFAARNIFKKVIHITKNVTGGMVVQAELADTAKLFPGEKVSINVKVNAGDTLVNNAKGAYRLYADEKFIKGGKLATNSSGETQIKFTYPQLTAQQKLRVNISFDKDSDKAELNLAMPDAQNPIILNAYAEGGHLIAGIPTKVVIKATNNDNTPVSAAVVIQKAGREFKKIQTDNNGIGVINLTSQAGQQYAIQVIGNNENKVNHFPKVETRGNSLKIAYDKDKSLHAVIYSKGYKGEALLLLHNYETVLWSKAVNLTADDSLNVTLPTDEVPKDVLSLALFDPKGDLKAERLFLNRAAQNDDYNLHIVTDQKIYGNRKKVTVTITATNHNNKPVEADLSVSATASGMVDMGNYQNILQAYRYRFLDAVKVNDVDEKNINDYLVTTGWQNVTWPRVIAYKTKGAPQLINNTDGIKGTISPLETSISITGWQLQAGTQKINVSIDRKGVFNIPSESLLTARGNEWQWAGGMKFKESYRVVYNNEDALFDNKIINGTWLTYPEFFNSYIIVKTQKQKQPASFSFNTVNELGEVVIENHTATIGDFWSANCDDYVCENDILNCPLHPPGTAGNHKPLEGKTYAVIDAASFSNRKVVYRGCKNILKTDMLKNVYIPLVFPLPDYERSSPAQPQIISTVYWNPNLTTDSNGKAVFSFFTSDIKGNYRIIAQGIKTGKTEPLYGAAMFAVK